MSKNSPLGRAAGPARVLGWVVAVGLVPALAAAGGKDKPPPPSDKKVAAGQYLSGPGHLLRRGPDDKGWRLAPPKATVSTAERLLALPGATAEMNLGKKALRLTLLGNLPELSDSPVLESAVVLHADPKRDLDFTLERGRVVLENRRAKGPAQARVRFRDQVWDLTLEEPGTRVALERYGRRQPGIEFRAKPGKDDVAAAAVVLVGLEGRTVVSAADGSSEPLPKRHMLRWSSTDGAEMPFFLKKFPSWVNPDESGKDARAARAAVKRLLGRLVGAKDAGKVLAAALKDADPATRTLAVYCLGAVDNTAGLVRALNDGKDPRVREAAVLDLRDWIGRRDDGHLRLHKALQKTYTPGQAGIVMQLLYGFSDAQLAQPETYDLLINYLKHDQLAVRELAGWHLYRLVPDGRSIAFDAAGGQAQLDRTYAAWRKLVPEGELPRRPKGKKGR